jgi:hypothetical protein
MACVFLIACQATAPQDARVPRKAKAQFYVSPSGSPRGDGTLSRPWDLITALNQPAAVRPGDTIWVRGGTYTNPGTAGFASHLKGTANHPILVRNYKGERATLDGRGAGTVLPVDGSYTWYWGLEVTDSNSTRTATMSGSFSNPRAAGVSTSGAGNKFINMVVHDTASGLGGGAASPDTEYYGNLVYYNGWIGPDRRHGHGFYMQNRTGLKIACDNFVGDNAEEGFQIYGSSAASLVGFRLFGNVTYNTSSWPSPNYQYNYILEGGGVSGDIQIENAYSYLTPQADYGFNLFGLADISVKNSVFVGGQIGVNFQWNTGSVVFTGNRVYNRPSASREITFVPSGATYTWDRNTYYGKNNFFNSGSGLTFPSWQQATGFDKNSTFTASAPTGIWVYVRPNKYESKRANVAIYNWDLASTVNVDLSNVLSVGDQFEVRDVQNFYGPAVIRGTYSGHPVKLRMVGLEKAMPIGFDPPAHTAPQFGTFLVMKR